MKRCKRCLNYVKYLKEMGKEAPSYVGTCVPFRFGRRLTTFCNSVATREFKDWMDLRIRREDAVIEPPKFETVEELEIAQEKYRE